MIGRDIFRFAFAYQAASAWPWICFAGLLLLTGLLAGQVQGDASLEDGFFFNAPYVIANGTQVATLLWLPVVGAITGSIAARGFQTRMFPLACATRTTKTAYLGGHLLAAFALNAIIGLAMTAAMLLSTLLPWVQPLLGPFRPEAYLEAYGALVLPNAFVATAFSFAFVVLRRKASAAYPAIALLLVMALFGSQFIARHLGWWDLAMLLDPLALTVVSQTNVAWSVAEKSTRLVTLDPMLWANRALWLGLAGGVLAWTWRRFRFAQVDGGRGAADRDRPEAVSEGPHPLPEVATGFGTGTRLRQAWTLALDGFRAVALGWPGAVLALLVLVFGVSGAELMEQMGVPLYPTTSALVDLLVHGEMIFVSALPLVLMLAAGELAWRDRNAGIAPLQAAAPVLGWVRFTGHLGALVLLALALQAVRMAAAMLVQASLGYHDFQPLLYLQSLFGLQMVDYVLFIVLAMALHAIFDHRHLGQLLVVTAFVLIIALPDFEIGGPMLVYATGPAWSHGDMSGFARDLAPWGWFRLYWLAWAALLALVALLFVPRGETGGLRDRLREAHARATPALRATGAGMVVALAGIGGFVFYNTHVLNPFFDKDELVARQVRYEQLYGKFEGVPQPVPTDLQLRVDLRPTQGTATVGGSYRLHNPTQSPIRVVHLATSHDVSTRVLGFDQPVRHVLADDDLGHHAFELSRPLLPGEATTMHFELAFAPRGFTRHGIDPAVISNGSVVQGNAWLPTLGYDPWRELRNPGQRRAEGLPAQPEVPPLDDPASLRDPARAQRVSVDTVIATAPGQTAIAPGLLRRQWQHDGRAHFHYVTEAPIRPDLTFYSADYAVLRDRWNDVEIEVFHHPEHPWNAARLIRAAKATLAIMSRDLGHYPYRHLRFTERPGSFGLHAAPGDVSFQEGYARSNPGQDWRGIDFTYGVAAHEVAHQWWGNQLIPAMVEGAPLLSESLAWYSALGVQREVFGEDNLARMLGVLRESYLTPRTRAGLPLLRAVDKAEAYREGPFAMHALREYLGADAMDAALARLLRAHRGGSLPLASSRDLYRELEAVTPPELQGLLHDLLAANTYWELSATDASARPMPDGRWAVTLDVKARKETVDEAGDATRVPMDGLVEIGVYGETTDGDTAAPLYRQMHRVGDGAQRFTIVVAARPAQAAIDPRHLLLDVDPSDNWVELP